MFSGYRDKELESVIQSLGGKVVGSVSKATTCVVVKDSERSDSTKVAKARSLGVRVLTAAQFVKEFGV